MQFADGVVGDGTLDYESQYQLAIVNCNYRDLTVTGTAEFFNPYWEHVSLRDRCVRVVFVCVFVSVSVS